MEKLSIEKVIDLINNGREIDLIYKRKLYQISHTDTLKLVASKDVQQEYGSTEELFNNFKIDGKTFADIWGSIEIECIL